MRVLLAHPPLLPGGEVTPPLGLCTLAAFLRDSGHEVRIIDLDLETKFAESDRNHQYLRIFAESIEDFRPGMVGVTSMYSNSLLAERLVRTAKAIDPQIATVAGGSHFGALAGQALARIPELDFVIVGEGEMALTKLVDAVEANDAVGGVPRLWHRGTSGVTANPTFPLIDLADLPPMWANLAECIDLSRYPQTVPIGAPRRIIYIEAGRGCPFKCTFCATAPFWERRYRVKSPARLVDEIAYLNRELGYDSFILVHDLLTVNKRFISQFCDAMLEAQLPVEWMANSRTDLRLDSLLPKMKAAGCWKLFMGVESASPQIQRQIDKHLEMGQVVATVTELRENGIGATCSFIIGFPNESPHDLSATIAFAARLKLMQVETVQFHRLRLFPPSELAAIALPNAAFDADGLRIEYPFVEVPEADTEAIASDPNFFAGYFTPPSRAGSPAEIAQVEMFFHHAVALAPFTIRLLSCFTNDNLVPSFYQCLASGGIRRDQLDWESGSLYGNWLAVEPLLQVWLSRYAGLTQWQQRVASGILDYERRRLQFLIRRPEAVTGVIAHTNDWVAFQCTVDVARLSERLRLDWDIPPSMLTSTAVVLRRLRDDSFDSFAVDSTCLEGLTSAQVETYIARAIPDQSIA